MVSCEPCFSLLETLEEMRQELRDNTSPRVDHRYADMIVRSFQADIDATTRRRELHGVRNEIPKYLLQAGRVAGDCPGERVERGRQRQVLCFGGRPDDIDRHLDDRRQFN